MIQCNIKGEWFCAKSALKSLRDELFTVLSGYLQQKRSRPDHAARAMLQFQKDYQKALSGNEAPADTDSGNVLHISGFIAENDLKLWQERIRQAHKSGIRNFSIGGIHGIILLKRALGSLENIHIRAVYPLPAANSCAIRLLKMMKVSAAEPWVELPESEVENLQKKSVLPLCSNSSDCELLTTRLPLKFKELTDKNQQIYRVKYDKQEKLYKLFGSTSSREKFRADENF